MRSGTMFSVSICLSLGKAVLKYPEPSYILILISLLSNQNLVEVDFLKSLFSLSWSSREVFYILTLHCVYYTMPDPDGTWCCGTHSWNLRALIKC